MSADERYQSAADVRADLGRLKREHGAVNDWFQRDLFPGWFLAVAGVQQDCISAVQKSLRRGFEVDGLRVEHGQVEIWFHEAQNAVGFDDGILRARENFADAGHGFREMALLGADPPGVIGSSNQESRSVGFAGAVFFFGHGEGMVGGGAIAGFSVGGADAVSVLRDF